MRKSKCLRDYFVLGRWVFGLATAANSFAALALNPTISVEESELRVTYGQPVQVQLGLQDSDQQQVTWQVLDDVIPPGLELSTTPGLTSEIVGIPYFTEQWCVTIGAIDSENVIVASRPVCFIGDQALGSTYPRFTTQKHLPKGKVGESYQAKIQIDPKYFPQGVSSELFYGELPPGLAMSFDPANSALIISGSPTEAIVKQFGLIVETKDQTQASYKQFQLSIKSPDATNPQCPVGYYFDPVQGQCVQAAHDPCPQGTYYDPGLDTCVAYPTPPPQITCPSGSYYDSFLNECVMRTAPRCPLNTTYDPYYGMCVENVRQCPLGTYYSYATQSCERPYVTECPSGSYYDPSGDRCIAYPISCPVGSYWDYSQARCVLNSWSCPSGTHYDSYQGQCVTNYVNCGPGAYWDSYYQRYCIPM